MTPAATGASIEAPLTLPCGLTLPNRLAKAALSEQLGTLGNAPTPALERLFRGWSEGGFGLLLTGNVMVDRRALGEPRNVVIEDRRHLDELRRWAAAAKAGGASAWVQLNHPGRQSPRVLSPRPVAPSAIALRGAAGQFAKPRALTGTEIEGLVERFATAAGIAVEAGFDGVQIHGAHGYLISQFLSPLTNQRDDDWGGDPQRRMRFLLEIVRAVRARIGDAALGVKLNSADFQRGGFSEAESMDVVSALSAERLDLLEISGGTYESVALFGHAESQRASTRAREAYFLEYAEAVRERASMPLMLTGGLRSRAGMDEALASGAIDLVGLGRPACFDDALAGRLLDGSLPAITTVPGLRTGVRALDDVAELSRHTTALWRLAAGRDAATPRHPGLALGEYAAATVRGAAGRTARRLLRR